jgi:uncharacterized membrane protein YciS (DUF1049 family)
MKYPVQLFSIFIIFINSVSITFANDNIFWVDDDVLKKGEIDITTIPGMIASVIQFVIWIAGTMAIVALIYNAVQMQLKSGITWDSSWVESAKKWMYWAIFWFVLAILSWFIVKRVIEILSTF